MPEKATSVMPGRTADDGRGDDAGTGRGGLNSGSHHTTSARPRKFRKGRKQYVRAADGRFVAYVQGRELIADRFASRQFLRQPPAIAFDDVTLGAAVALRVQSVVVTDLETQRVYRAPLTAFYDRGIRIDRGGRAQLALPLTAWSVDDPRQLKLRGVRDGS